MKKILFVALMACVVVGCSKSTSDQTPNSLQQSGLNGPVKSVDMRTYEATTYFGDVKKGDPISTEDMSFNFPLYAGLRYDYNSDGDEVQVTMRNKEGQIDQVQKKEYFQNHLIGEKYYDNRGDLSYSWRYEIKNDKPVSQIVTYYLPGAFDSSQKSTMSDTLECVFDGFLLKATYVKEDGETVLGSEFNYEKGLVVSRVNYNQDNSVFRVEWKRNDAGMITRFSMTDDEKEMMAEELTYDERGFLMRYILRGMEFKESESLDYTFEYLSVDEYGNWTRRVVNKDQMPRYLQERTILYYDDQPEQKGRPERKKR